MLLTCMKSGFGKPGIEYKEINLQLVLDVLEEDLDLLDVLEVPATGRGVADHSICSLLIILKARGETLICL